MKNIVLLLAGTVAFCGVTAGNSAAAFPASGSIIARQIMAEEQTQPVHMRRHRHHHGHHSYRRYRGNPYGYYGYSNAPRVYAPYGYGYYGYGGGHHFGEHHFGGHHGEHH